MSLEGHIQAELLAQLTESKFSQGTESNHSSSTLLESAFKDGHWGLSGHIIVLMELSHYQVAEYILHRLTADGLKWGKIWRIWYSVLEAT